MGVFKLPGRRPVPTGPMVESTISVPREILMTMRLVTIFSSYTFEVSAKSVRKLVSCLVCT